MNREASAIIKEIQAGTDTDSEPRTVMVLDEVHCFDPDLAKEKGVRLEDVWVAQPKDRSETLEIFEKFAEVEHGFILMLLGQDFPRWGACVFHRIFKKAEANKTSVIEITWAMPTQ